MSEGTDPKSEKAKKKLEQLKKKAKAFGLDIDQLLAEFKKEVVQEIKASMPPPTPGAAVNKDEIVDAVKLEIAGQITSLVSKLDDAAKDSDPKQLINSLVEILQPKIVEASQKVAQEVYRQGAEGLLAQVRKDNEATTQKLKESIEKLKSNPKSGSDEEEEEEEGHAAARGDGLGSLVGQVFAHLEEIKELVAVFKPAPAQTDIVTLLKGIRIGETISKGNVTADVLGAALLPPDQKV